MSENRISSTAGTGNIQCPFFVAHGKTEILCEGIVEGTKICTKFPDPERKAFHQMTYCEKEFRRCELCCSIRHWQWPEECD